MTSHFFFGQITDYTYGESATWITIWDVGEKKARLFRAPKQAKLKVGSLVRCNFQSDTKGKLLFLKEFPRGISPIIPVPRDYLAWIRRPLDELQLEAAEALV